MCVCNSTLHDGPSGKKSFKKRSSTISKEACKIIYFCLKHKKVSYRIEK